MRFGWVAPFLFAFAPVCALADAACDHPRDDFDGLYCLNKVYQAADADLNQWFPRLRAKLDPAGQASLRRSQLNWLGERNTKCSRREGAAFYVNLKCATEMTVQRTEFLESAYRGCLAGACPGFD